MPEVRRQHVRGPGKAVPGLPVGILVSRERREGMAQGVAGKARTAAVLAFIIEHRGRLGYSPSIRDICAHFGWASTNAARHHLWRLAGEGRLQLGPPGVSRAFVPVPEPDSAS